MELSAYALQPLREDEEFILYRGRPTQAEAASVLLLAPASRHPAIETIEKINHEYALRRELGTIWAVRPRDLSQYNEKTVLVLDDPGGEPLHHLVQGPMEIKQFL